MERQTSAVISLAEDFVSLAPTLSGGLDKPCPEQLFTVPNQLSAEMVNPGDFLLPKGIPGGEMKDTPRENTARQLGERAYSIRQLCRHEAAAEALGRKDLASCTGLCAIVWGFVSLYA